MKASVFYRSAAVLLLLFAVGHTLGFRQSDPQWGVDALLGSMRSIHFDVQGFNRSYWEIFEAAGFSVGVFYPFAAIAVGKEQKRLKRVQFVQTIPPRVIAPPAPMQLDPAEESLQAAEGLYEQHDFQNARKIFKKVFEQTSDKPKQVRAYYGLALIDLQEKHWDEALDLFQRTVDTNPNSATAAWSHYYLGQLALKAGDSEKATAQFKLTLATEGVWPKAREATERA